MKGLEGVFPIKNKKGDWIAILMKDDQSGEHITLSVKKMTSEEIFAMYEDLKDEGIKTNATNTI